MSVTLTTTPSPLCSEMEYEDKMGKQYNETIFVNSFTTGPQTN